MASPTAFHKSLYLVICVGLAWFSVVAKPIELPALEQPRYFSNVSHVLAFVGTGGVYNEKTVDVDQPQSTTFVGHTPTCTDHVHDASDCKVTDVAPIAHTITCLPPPHCSLDAESVGTTHSCYTGNHASPKLNTFVSVKMEWGSDTSFSASKYENSSPQHAELPGGTTAQPAKTTSIETNSPPSLSAGKEPEQTITVTAELPHGQDDNISGPEPTLATPDASDPVPGQKTVYVTITNDPTTTNPIPAQPFSNKPLSTGHPESNKTAIILGSVFGSLAILCISIVSVDHLLKLRRRKREELQENHESQECQDSVSTIEDVSELLRHQQQTYGYYGTQRVASSTIVPQQMKSFPISSEPVELPTPKDDSMDKEGREGH